MNDKPYDRLIEKIGVIGGGQLGKMLTMSAKKMGFHVSILDPVPGSPAGQVADRQIVASFCDAEAIKKLASECDVLTFEFEHIDAKVLIGLEAEGHCVIPSGRTLSIIQDKFAQKTMLHNMGIPVADFADVTGPDSVSAVIGRIGLPLILKTRTDGYDGKGILRIETAGQLIRFLQDHPSVQVFAEKLIPFSCELSVVAARWPDGRTVQFPIAENVHEDGILRLSRIPARISPDVELKVKKIVDTILSRFDDCGVFCIELFATSDGNILVNEIAPRPHNSGHYTVEACATSQFEQLVRILTGLPPGSVSLRRPCVMVNLLGENNINGSYRLEGLADALQHDDLHFHLYGKSATAHLKKLGHITVLADRVETAETSALSALSAIKIVSAPK